MVAQKDWCFPYVTQLENSSALMIVPRGEGPVQSTLCYVCPDSVNMEPDMKQTTWKVIRQWLVPGIQIVGKGDNRTTVQKTANEKKKARKRRESWRGHSLSPVSLPFSLAIFHTIPPFLVPFPTI